jgi:site-specific DNA recombinase
MEKEIKVVVYIRVNKIEQLEVEPAINKQYNAIFECCKQNGWEPINQFIDIGESANTDKRPKFQEMIAMTNEPDKYFKKIVIYSFDRFSRNFHHFYKYLSILRKNGVSLYSISENRELPDSFPIEEIFNVIKTYPATVIKHINSDIQEEKKGSENNG